MTADDPLADRVSTGRVVEFDAHRGWGALVDDHGRRFGFHCAVIADGSRTVEVGARVRFRPLARLGAVEATDVAPE